MANITNELNKINNAVYGKEVRGAIHDAIKKAYDDASKNGNANMEVVFARGDSDTLNGRLDKSDSHLLEKSNQVDVRLKSVPVNLNGLGQDVLDALEASEGVGFNIFSIPREKSVSPEKTSFLKTSTNMFNKHNLVKGYNIDSLTGDLIESEDLSVSDFISSNPDTYYSYSRIAKFVWYDENFNFINPRTQLSPTLSLPDTYYMRVVIESAYVNVAQINEGKTLLPYAEYKTEFNESENFIFPERPLSESFGKLIGDADLINFSWSTRELLIADKSTRILYKDRSYLLPGQNVPLPEQGWHKLIYDTKEEKVKTIASSIETPKKTICFGVIHSGKNVVNYIENYYVDGKSAEEVNGGNNEVNEKDYFLPPEIPIGWYEAPEVEGYEAPSHYQDNITFETVYDVFDRLISDNPDYVSKTNHGNESTGTYPFYSHEFKPEDVESSLFNKKMPKIIIFTNTHGEEKSSTIGVRNFMRDVCDNWENDPLLEFVRFNVHLIIVPIVNPYGFVNFTRKNGNKVDINRNSGFRWNTSDNTDPNATTYKGTHAFSEKEAQYIRDIILANKDAIACYDYHTNGSSGVVYRDHFWHYLENFQEVQGFNETNVIAKYNISKLTRESQKRYGIPKDSGHLGYITYNSSSSTIATYAFSEGIPAMTIECTKRIVGETPVYSARTLQVCTEFIGNTILNTVREFAK